MNTSQGTIKSAHVYITQYARSKASKRQETGTDTHITKAVCKHENIIALCNKGVQTDREVLAKRPDIIIKNNTDKMCLLADVAIPSDRNVIYKKAERKLKYKNLSIEIQRMWNIKRFVIPVRIGTNLTVTKGLKYL
jgi:hypothetical protein